MVGVSSSSVDIEYRSEETTPMTRDEKIIRNKVGVLELASWAASARLVESWGFPATASTDSGTWMKQVHLLIESGQL